MSLTEISNWPSWPSSVLIVSSPPVSFMASMALSMRFINTCWSCTRSAVILGRSGASSVRIEIEYRLASSRSKPSMSRTISFTSTNSRCGGAFLYNDRRRSMISVARVPSFTILFVASSASSTSGWSRFSHRMQVFALVIAAAMGCFSSWDNEAASSPKMLRRFICARSARSFSRSCFSALAIFDVG